MGHMTEDTKSPDYCLGLSFMGFNGCRNLFAEGFSEDSSFILIDKSGIFP